MLCVCVREGVFNCNWCWCWFATHYHDNCCKSAGFVTHPLQLFDGSHQKHGAVGKVAFHQSLLFPVKRNSTDFSKMWNHQSHSEWFGAKCSILVKLFTMVVIGTRHLKCLMPLKATSQDGIAWNSRNVLVDAGDIVSWQFWHKVLAKTYNFCAYLWWRNACRVHAQ